MIQQCKPEVSREKGRKGGRREGREEGEKEGRKERRKEGKEGETEEVGKEGEEVREGGREGWVRDQNRLLSLFKDLSLQLNQYLSWKESSTMLFLSSYHWCVNLKRPESVI